MDTKRVGSLDLSVLAAAPHRLLFFIGAANVLAAMAWWTGGLGGWLPTPSVPAGWMHGFVMQYQVLPTFIFGFLLTVVPHWMAQAEASQWHYLPVGLGDTVWSDTDADGLQDVGETGMQGVTVVLYDAVAAAPLLTTTTNSGGVYTFTNLTPGDYFVGFRVPAGYAASPRDVGSDDAADSDADPQTGQTVSTTLTVGENK